jgi:hypothetical protein
LRDQIVGFRAESILRGALDDLLKPGKFQSAHGIGLSKALGIDLHCTGQRNVEAYFAALEAGDARRTHVHQQEGQHQRGKGDGGKTQPAEAPVGSAAARQPLVHERPPANLHV